MSGIQLRTNIASLNAQRLLGESTARLQTSFERLSSGLRINRASDDAAGLAIAKSLNTDRRVFSQGIRNANDALSLLNIAEGTMIESSAIVTRLKELSEQAANGTLTQKQRLSLHEEGKALVDEYNRLMNTSSFNDLKLLDGSLSELIIQAGYGTDGQMRLELGNKASRIVGDGTFQEGEVKTTVDPVGDVATADFNGDGYADIVAGSTGSDLSIFMNNGDGTFANRTTLATGNIPYTVATVDTNADGYVDIVTAASLSDQIEVFLSNGDGTFDSAITTSTGSIPFGLGVGDFNNDSIVDLATYTQGDNTIEILLGNGDGSFQLQSTLPASSFGGLSGTGLAVGDITGDGKLDIVGLHRDNSEIHVYEGKGDGAFSLIQTLTPASGAGFITLGDTNQDGYLDLISEGDDVRFSIFLGRPDGTFGAREDLETSSGERVSTIDFNGDGILDLISTGPDGIRLARGNGDGTFAQEIVPPASVEGGLALDDFNGDGVLDFVASSGGNSGDTISIHLANTKTVTTLQYINLTRQDTALQALDDLTLSLQRISDEIANIGAFQSRVGSAVRTLQQRVESLASAQSQIEDVDVAEETAKLTKENILQQIGASVLAQANALPSLALRLLQA